MTKLLKKQISNVSTHQRKIFYVLVSLIVIASSFYGFFVKQTIMDVVEREKIQKEARTITSDIGDLESEYIAEKGKITLEFAYAQGFRDALDTHYITRKTLSRNTLSGTHAY